MRKQTQTEAYQTKAVGMLRAQRLSSLSRYHQNQSSEEPLFGRRAWNLKEPDEYQDPVQRPARYDDDIDVSGEFT